MEQKKNHKKQLKIAHETRKELIRLVTYQKISVKSAHCQLGINYSTAKMIVRKYKQSGRITQFRRERKKIVQENLISESLSIKQLKQDAIPSDDDRNAHLQTQKMPIYRFQNLTMFGSENNYYVGLIDKEYNYVCIPSLYLGFPLHNNFYF